MVPFDKENISKGASVLSQGGTVVFPTDTVYGIGCNPEDDSAVMKVIKAKGRENKPIPLLCSSIERASELVELNTVAVGLAQRYWPGALTIVAPMKRQVSPGVHQGGRTIGVRVPQLPLLIELIEMSGGSLTGTSANTSGTPPSRTAEESRRALGESVDLIMDGGPLTGRESTVVRVDGNVITILRQGAVGVSDVIRR